MTSYTVGILVIGSLFWDKCQYRESWRQKRLNLEDRIPVYTPIRYGRLSPSRGDTYTMVFSNELPTERYGRALVVPCCNRVTSAADLVIEGKALWAAERSESETDRLSASWGAVGLLTNPGRAGLDAIKEIKKDWIEYIEKKKEDRYKDFPSKKGEQAAVDSKGVLMIPWPCTESGDRVDMDFLLATATVPCLNIPTQKEGEYATPETIAKAWNKAPDERCYFDKNRCAGIITADDDAIIKHLCES